MRNAYRWCEEHPDAKLIIVDTLQKFRGSGDKHLNAYENDYAALGALHAIAHRFSLALVFVHHTRKAKADDIYETVSGSSAMTGTPDTNMVLKRERSVDDQGTLHVDGRDIEETYEWAMEFKNGVWSWLGAANDVRSSKMQDDVLTVLKANGNKPMSPQDIVLAMGKSKDQRGMLVKVLNHMLDDCRLVKHEGGKYSIAPTGTMKPPPEGDGTQSGYA